MDFIQREKQKELLRELEKQIKEKEILLKEVQDDPLKGWKDTEIKAIQHDATMKHLVEESHMSRKIRAIEERRLYESKRTVADLKTQTEFADDLKNPEFEAKIKEVIAEHGLEGNPKARYIAAKIAKNK